METKEDKGHLPTHLPRVQTLKSFDENRRKDSYGVVLRVKGSFWTF